jgi:hypothetical protein
MRLDLSTPQAIRRHRLTETITIDGSDAVLGWTWAEIPIESTRYGQTSQTVFLEVYDEQRLYADGADRASICPVV